MKTSTQLLGAAAGLIFSLNAYATIVRIETNHGNIDINLYDETTPKTVENFLSYVSDGSYDGTIIHRKLENFIIQGGGVKLTGDNENMEPTFTPVAAKPSVMNEPLLANVAGTIAMAKIGGLPNSATTEWFINTNDNSANLDNQNEGFTAFGEVVNYQSDNAEPSASRVTVNKINSAKEYNATAYYSALASIPLFDITDTQTPFDETNTVNVISISVIDDAIDSAKDLNPQVTTAAAPKKKSSGATPLWALGFFSLLALGRKRAIKTA